jgi:hypothetical protein
MNNNIKYITRENELNKLIKEQKSGGRREHILFISLWDKVSNNLLEKLKESSTRVSIINSFDTPHSFVIWGITKAPCLITLEGKGYSKRMSTSFHVTDIYKRLRLEK